MKQPKIVEDPRPDLAYDSRDWMLFLTMLEAVDPKAAGVLHGFRCGGLRLHRGGKGYGLRPEFDPETSIWRDEAAYKRDRDQWLVPIGPTIVQALNTLTQAMTERGGTR